MEHKVCRSLRKMMLINRGRFINHINLPILPTKPNPIITYQLSDFGENAINNHSPYDSSHSSKNQVIFNYVTKNFRDRCISYESYKTSPYNGFVNDELAVDGTGFEKSEFRWADELIQAYWMNRIIKDLEQA